MPTIIAAKPGANGESSQIVVWKKTRAQEGESEPVRAGDRKAHTGDPKANITQILMFIASLAFIWQNIEVRIVGLNLSQRKELTYSRSLQRW